MSSYSGPATAVLTDGTEIPVTASLHKGVVRGLWSWRGALSVGRGHDLWPIVNAGTARLRLPDGRIGDILAANFTVTNAGQRPMQITGSGEPPF